MSLKHVGLELARTPEFPHGNSACGYESVTPLSRHGLLDCASWQRDKDRCTVRRFWQNAEEAHGALVHRRNADRVFPAGQDTTLTSRSSALTSTASRLVSMSRSPSTMACSGRSAWSR